MMACCETLTLSGVDTYTRVSRGTRRLVQFHVLYVFEMDQTVWRLGIGR